MKRLAHLTPRRDDQPPRLRWSDRRIRLGPIEEFVKSLPRGLLFSHAADDNRPQTAPTSGSRAGP